MFLKNSQGPPYSLAKKWLFLQMVLAEQSLSCTAKLIAARLLYHLNQNTGQCNPSYETLARGIGRSRRVVIDGVAELERASWIEVDRCSHAEAAADRRALTSNSFLVCFDRSESSGAEDSTSLVQNIAPASVEIDTSASAEDRSNLVQKTAPKGNKGKGDKSEKEKREKLQTEIDAEFEEFWRRFPHHGRRRAPARKKFVAIVRTEKATPDELITGATRFAMEKEGVEARWITLADNWLAREGWKDAFTAPTRIAPTLQDTHLGRAMARLGEG